MKTFFLTFRSITQAQRAERAFAQAGMAVLLRRTPRWMEEQGCGYALKLWSSDILSVVRLLQENKLQLRKVYAQLENGEMEEVRL